MPEFNEIPWSICALIIFTPLGIICLLRAFACSDRAIERLRTEHPDHYAAMGRPVIPSPLTLRKAQKNCHFEPERIMAGCRLQIALLFKLPEDLPEDELLVGLFRQLQLYARLWNSMGLPLFIWVMIDVVRLAMHAQAT